MLDGLEHAVYRHRQALIAVFIALPACLLAVPLMGYNPEPTSLSYFFFVRQDLPILGLVFACLVLLKPDPKISPSNLLLHLDTRSVPQVALLCIALVTLCWFGHYAVFQGYDFSRDEQMANFDAWIFGHGKLFWPMPLSMASYAQALNQIFILPIGNQEAWVSNYLPINSALRAAVGTVADPALTSPILVGIGALALWRITLRIWPNSASTRAAALILYASSSQVILTGMTAYAMSAHLALNLLWLAMFLRNNLKSHAAAIAIGFFATGLHQPIFHPLFVLPFMLLLLRQERWRMLLLYGICYGAICLFWLLWPVWISSHGTALGAAPNDAPVDYFSRLITILSGWSLGGIWLMGLNFIRFITWQHMLLCPLILLGLTDRSRENGIFGALAMGVGLTALAMMILLPYQGHGWGYRYLHGVIGNLCLLGAHGWHIAEQKGVSFKRAFTVSTAVSIGLILPVRAYMARSIVAPYVALDHQIKNSSAAITLVETTAAPFAQDLVLNNPDLSNRPLRLILEKLTGSQLAALCKSGQIAIVDSISLAPVRLAFGAPDTPQPLSPSCAPVPRIRP